MMFTTFGVAAAALAATLINQPYVGLYLLPLVPLAGVIGYFQRRPSDQLLAQLLDQQLQTRELLASGVSCREKHDDASRMITAQADACAARIDREKLAVDSGIKRSEAAAGLVLAIALSAVFVFNPSSDSSDLKQPAAIGQTASNSQAQRGTLLTPPSLQEERASMDQPSEAGDESLPSTGTSDAVRRPSRDAAGEGMAQTATRGPSAVPAARIPPPASAEKGEATGTGIGQSSERGVSSDQPAANAIAPRRPLSLDQTLPPPAARQQAQAELETGRIGFESRDLIRAYFDLDQPQ